MLHRMTNCGRLFQLMLHSIHILVHPYIAHYFISLHAKHNLTGALQTVAFVFEKKRKLIVF